MKFTKKLFLLILSGILMLSCIPAFSISAEETDKEEVEEIDLSETLPIVVGAKEDGQPYIFVEDGEVKGFEADMWKEIAERANLEVSYEFNSISGLFGLLDTKKIDTISHFLGATPERAKKYDFSMPYSAAGLNFMIQKDEDEIKSMEDLHGKTVAIALGSAAASVIESLDPEGKIELKPYEEFRSIPMDIENGRVYAYFGNPITMMIDIETMGLENVKVSPKAFNQNVTGYPFRKDDEEAQVFIERINYALAGMLEEGVVKEISEEWFKLDTTKDLRKPVDMSETLSIRVGAKEDGHPYIYLEDGEVKGFEADMWKEIAERANLEITYEYNSISGLFGLLDTNKIDTISHFLGATEERAKKYDFSAPYSAAGLNFMIQKDEEDIESMEDLYGKTVAIALGSAAASVIESLDPDGKIEVKPYEEFRSIPMDIDNGRVYAYFGNPITMMIDIESMGLENVKVSPKAFNQNVTCYPFRKDDEESKVFIERINYVLEDMINEGVVKEISEKWFNLDTTVDIEETFKSKEYLNPEK